VQAAWRRLGLFGALLAAAVMADVVVAVTDLLTADHQNFYPFQGRWHALMMVPGSVVLAACAVVGRKNPMLGAGLGSLALVLVSPLAEMRSGGYTSLLTGISLAETVAGLQLVVLAHRMLPTPRAIAATAMLVVGCLAAVSIRGSGHPHSDTLFVGFVLLVAAVVFGRRKTTGKPAFPDESSRYAVYLTQWPLIGVLALFLFLEFVNSSGSLFGMAVVLLSLAAAGLAVLSVQHPITAGFGLAGVFLVSGILGGAWDVDFPGVGNAPLPAVHVLAGIVVSVNLVRYRKPEAATGVIAVMSVAVAITTALRTTGSELQRLAITALLFLGLAVALGLYLRSRDAARAQLMSAAVAEAKSAERMALARELHDVVAHHVTGIVVQAQAAKMVAKNDPKLTQEAFDRIEAAGIEAMTAMRRLVASIRSGEPSDTPTEDATMDLAADLRKLVDNSTHGVPTVLQTEISADLPPEVARSALRIVQEALTNIGKHATDATEVRVVVGVVEQQLGIRVSDNGRGGGEPKKPAKSAKKPSWRDSGYGLVGMRERVALLHGRLSVGPAPDGGWVVEAWLPLTVEDNRK